MSGQPLELCYELSYHDEIDGLPCRGPAKLLLDGLEAFAKEHQDLSGPNILTMHYLHLPPYGLRHSLLTTDVTGQDNVLVWDRVSDKMK